jgi:HemY protein
MRFLIWLLALFAAAVAVTLLSHNDGYVLFVHPPYRMEMSLTMFVFVLIVLFIAAHLLVQLILSAVQLPRYVRAFRAERAQSKGRTAMQRLWSLSSKGVMPPPRRQP